MRELYSQSDLKNLLKSLREKVPLALPVIVALEAKLMQLEFPQRTFVPLNQEKQSSLVIQTDITFKTLSPSKQSINIFWDSNDIEEKELVDYLLKLPDWTWKKPFVLGYLGSPLVSKLVQVLKTNFGLVGDLLEPVLHPLSFWTLNQEDAKEFRVPTGYKLGTLLPHHMDYVAYTWPYEKVFDTSFLFRNELVWSVAIFEEKADMFTENPVTFVLQYPCGEMGMCYTEKEHRRKGLALVVENELAQKLFQHGCTVAIAIEEGNTKSERMHEKLGLKKNMDGGWVYFVQEDDVADVKALFTKG